MVVWYHLIVNHLTTVNLTFQAKMIELPFIRKGEHARGPLDLIHFDVCGPCPLMPEVVSSTSLLSSMIIRDLGTWIS